MPVHWEKEGDRDIIYRHERERHEEKEIYRYM